MLEISYYKKKKMTNCISFFLWFVFIYIYIYIFKRQLVSFFFGKRLEVEQPLVDETM